jgi:hypothetical protein
MKQICFLLLLLHLDSIMSEINDFFVLFLFRCSDFRPTSLEKSQESCRLRIYHVWAWGVPLLIAIVAAILDQMPSDEAILRPRFGEKRCWFYGKYDTHDNLAIKRKTRRTEKERDHD